LAKNLSMLVPDSEGLREALALERRRLRLPARQER
jgi:hypothetical protein